MSIKFDRLLCRRSILMGPLCQGLDLGLIAGSFCVYARPVERFVSRAAHLKPASWLTLQVPLASIAGCAALYLGWRVALLLPGIYAPQQPSRRAFLSYLLRCLIALNGCTAVAAAGFLLLRLSDPWQALAGFWVTCFVLLLSVRVVLSSVSANRQRRLRLLSRRKVLVAGTGARALEVLRAVETSRSAPYRLQGFLRASAEPAKIAPELILGDTGQLAALLAHGKVDELVVALPLDGLYEIVGKLVAICREHGVEVRASADFLAEVKNVRPFAPVAAALRNHEPGELPRHWTERAFDSAVAVAGLVVFAPVFLLAAVAIKMTSAGPVFAREQESAADTPLHFRCTYVGRGTELTPVGAALRNTAIDRLPRLLDVLRGSATLRSSHLLERSGRHDEPLHT